MKLVPFTTNSHTSDTHFMVSDEHFGMVIGRKWHVHNNVSSKDNKPHYVIQTTGTKSDLSNGFPKTLKLHRLLLGLKKGDKTVVDHKNGWLDNTIEGLRPTSMALNSKYRRPRKRLRADTQDLLKGVCQVKGRYRAVITCNGQRKHLGYFKTPDKAHEAYCVASLELHGEFSKTK